MTTKKPSELFALIDSLARSVGVACLGTRGTGKSSFMSILAWCDFYIKRKPVFIIDITGGVAGRLLTQVARQQAHQERIWPFVRYVPLAHPTRVVPTPFYAPHGYGRETFWSLAQRFPDLILRADSALSRAGIQGAPPLNRLSVAGGVIMQALGHGGPHEMSDLLLNPKAWSAKLQEAERRHPDSEQVASAVRFFQDVYPKWSESLRNSLAGSLLTKLAIFDDEGMRAQFSARKSGLDLNQAVERGELVIFDLSGEHQQQPKTFKMLFIFLYLIDFLKRRGEALHGDRSRPVSLIIDETVDLLGAGNTESPLLAADFRTLIDVYSRNFAIELTLGMQEPSYQLPDDIRETFLSLATHVIGRLTDPEAQRLMVERHCPYQPHRVKHWRITSHSLLELEPVFYTPQEQSELDRQRFRDLPQYHFLVAPVIKEGQPPLPLQEISTEILAQAMQPDPVAVRDAKRALIHRDGRRIADVLAELKPQPKSLAPPQPLRPQSLTDDYVAADALPDPTALKPPYKLPPKRR
jgi:hypothetical protein